jgi:hypothetical protein
MVNNGHESRVLKVVKAMTQGYRNSDDFFSSRRSRLPPVVIRQAPSAKSRGESAATFRITLSQGKTSMNRAYVIVDYFAF